MQSITQDDKQWGVTVLVENNSVSGYRCQVTALLEITFRSFEHFMDLVVHLLT